MQRRDIRESGMRFVVIDLSKLSEPISQFSERVKRVWDISVVFEVFDKSFNPRFVIRGMRSSVMYRSITCFFNKFFNAFCFHGRAPVRMSNKIEVVNVREKSESGGDSNFKVGSINAIKRIADMKEEP